MEITVCFDLPSGDGDGTNAEAAAADANNEQTYELGVLDMMESLKKGESKLGPVEPYVSFLLTSLFSAMSLT